MSNLKGPLTERQLTIIDRIRSGKRYHRIAAELDVSQALVHHEASNIMTKLKAATIPQAITLYTMAMAYRGVADQLDTASRAHPERDGVAEDHVNHVLRALANEYRSRAARLLPQ